MRTISSIAMAVLATGAVAFLTACSGGEEQAVSSALPGSGSALWRTGIAPPSLHHLRFGGRAAVPGPDTAKAPAKLAISDFETGKVEVLNGSYTLESTIGKGLDGPDGDDYDGSGNLYVANYESVSVTEFNEKEKKTFAYSTGLTDPVSVTTDTSGNVYVADFGDHAPSVVVEYRQRTNTPVASCSTGFPNEGVAVDKKGDVFVAGQDFAHANGIVLEYAGGLSGCSPKTVIGEGLVRYAGGLQIDNKGDLVVCDQQYGAVYVLPPPYNYVSWVIGGATDPFHVALDKSNRLIFIADPVSMDVLVASYPTGRHVTTLNSANGLSDPLGVAAFP